MMTRKSVGVVGSIVLLVGLPARAATFTYSSSGDSYIRLGYPNANNGSEDILRVRKTGPARTLIRFPPAAIAADAAGGVVQSAALTLFVESASQFASGALIDVHRLQTDWTELDVTWNVPSTGAPTWNGGTYVSSPTASYAPTNGQVGTVTIDVTADVASFLLGTNNFGWLLKKRLEDQEGGVVFTSRDESVDVANRPKLVVVVSTPSGLTPTATPPPAATSTPTLTPTLGLGASCRGTADNPKACDKIATFPLRSLRDWAACLERNAPSVWGTVDGASPPDDVGCGVYLDDGGAGVNNCNLQSPATITEPELQSSESASNCELERGLQHCEYKLIYQNECTLADWAVVEHYLAGALPSSPNDVFKYEPDAWYPCIPWQRDTIFKTIADVWLPFLANRVTCNGGTRDGLSCMANEGCPGGLCASAIDPVCAHQALAAIGESLDEFIYQAGDDNDTDDRKAFWECETAFGNTAVKNNCGTCTRTDGSPADGYDSSLDCPGAEQITARQWDDLCKFLKAQYNPFRQACREKPGTTTSGPGWSIAPTPTAIP